MKGHFTPHSEEAKQKMREAKLRNPVRYWLGKELPDHVRKLHSEFMKGKKYAKGKTHKNSDEFKEKMRIKMTGSNSPNWKGGISRVNKTERQIIMETAKYKIWRQQVFERDGYKCKIANEECKTYLEAHHILRWADYPELRFDLNNGITLCSAHHPRGRVKENQLAPILQELIKNA